MELPRLLLAPPIEPPQAGAGERFWPVERALRRLRQGRRRHTQESGEVFVPARARAALDGNPDCRRSDAKIRGNLAMAYPGPFEPFTNAEHGRTLLLILVNFVSRL